MNQIEVSFRILTRRAIYPGSCGLVQESLVKIGLFVGNWNAGASHSAWLETADEFRAKPVRERRAVFELRPNADGPI
jgi:hypothetical protein